MSKFQVGDVVKLSEIGKSNMTGTNGEPNLFFKGIGDSTGVIVRVYGSTDNNYWDVSVLFESYNNSEPLAFKDEELDLVATEIPPDAIPFITSPLENEDLYSYIGDPTAKPDDEIGEPMRKVSGASFVGDSLTMAGAIVLDGKPEKQVGKFEARGKALGELVDSKELAYGSSVAQTYELMKIFLKKHYNEEKGVYMVSEDLLKQILLQVRIIDKQNRIFNNPSQDLMEENTYNDLVGYSLIGGDLTGR